MTRDTRTAMAGAVPFAGAPEPAQPWRHVGGGTGTRLRTATVIGTSESGDDL